MTAELLKKILKEIKTTNQLLRKLIKLYEPKVRETKVYPAEE